MIKGKVFNIQRYCTEDGPGIRTAVFLKGCPLSCLWCSNPESQKSSLEFYIDNALCRRCHKCIEVCRTKAITIDFQESTKEERLIINRDKCIGCDDCRVACPAGAAKSFGEIMTTEEVLKEVLKDKVFYERSGGGLTITGGEPTLQSEFSKELIVKAKSNGIKTLLETAGCTSWETFKNVALEADKLYYDLKFINPSLHKKYTNKDNKLILENLKRITSIRKGITVRIPLIPGINDSEDEIASFGKFIASLNRIERIGLLPYHKYGINKYRLLNRSYLLESLAPPTEEKISLVSDMLNKLTGYTVIVGS